ncbi:MAG: hypothetical protein Q9169_000824 [Polycauliona sp. 2 TL-2023]
MPTAVEPHVPAWRKLGLKLKNVSEPAATISEYLPASQKRRKTQGGGNQENIQEAEYKPIKRAKRTIFADSNADDSKNATDITSPSTTISKKATPRKSVSFEAGAKTEDGESAKDLYNTWIDSQKSLDQSFNPSSFNQDALRAITPTSIDVADRNPTTLNSKSSSKDPQTTSIPKNNTNKKKKKRNKPKSTTLSKATSTSNGSAATTPTKTLPSNQPATIHPALTYLSTHYSSPSTWKFSKSRSSYLLRHLFSLTHIPASYTLAIESYLSGLESRTAGQAIRQRALDIIKEDDEWLSDDANFEGWDLRLETPAEEEEEEEGGGAEAIKMDDPVKRRQLFIQALKHHAQTLRAREDDKEQAEKDRTWQGKIERRKRVEGVLRTLNEHVYGNANSPQIKQSFTPTAPAAGQDTANGNTNGMNGGGYQQRQQPQKGKRKRKRRTMGVPDDDSSSSSSSSSSASSSGSESEPLDDGKRMGKRAKRIQVLDKKIRVLKGEESSSSDETSGSESEESGSET